MLPFFTQVSFAKRVHAYVELSKKAAKGIESLSKLREEDIEIGLTPKEEVYREDKVVLYHFQPMGELLISTPLLVVAGLINRPFMVDLEEKRSLIANLLKLGLDVYLIDWGYPTRADRWLTLDDHINGYLNNCIDVLRKKHGLEKINLLGLCQGGNFSLCYSSIYPQKVKNLILMVTPVDFHIPNALLNMRAGVTLGSEAIDIDLVVDAFGNVPGDFLCLEFLLLKPYQNGIQKYIDSLEIMENEEELLTFMRMEKWIFDSPDQAGETYRQFMKDFYQENKLIKGELMVGENLIELEKIRMPILNIYAEKDHFVPPPSCTALEKYIGSEDYTVQSFPVGHIGIYVSRKVQKDLPLTIAHWLKERDD
ncbi:MAG: class III poly(R)-hydroxyalkanoic acid synthase subunit PhaC [Limnoraphis robusta]